MSAHVSLQRRITDYLTERRRLGFELRSRDTLLAGFARYVAAQHHRGPLTADLMIEWARHDKWHHETPATWAARLARVRHFARYLKQFEPETEVPEETVFGPEAGQPLLQITAEIMSSMPLHQSPKSRAAHGSRNHLPAIVHIIERST